ASIKTTLSPFGERSGADADGRAPNRRAAKLMGRMAVRPVEDETAGLSGASLDAAADTAVPANRHTKANNALQAFTRNPPSPSLCILQQSAPNASLPLALMHPPVSAPSNERSAAPPSPRMGAARGGVDRLPQRSRSVVG